MLSGIESGFFSDESDDASPTAIPGTNASALLSDDDQVHISAPAKKAARLHNLPGRRSLDEVHRDAARLIRGTPIFSPIPILILHRDEGFAAGGG